MHNTSLKLQFWVGWSNAQLNFIQKKQNKNTNKKGKKTMRGLILFYNWPNIYLILCNLGVYSSFKGEKKELSCARTYKNFVKSKSHMTVEQAFGILKGRRKTLLKIINMCLQYMFFCYMHLSSWYLQYS